MFYIFDMEKKNSSNRPLETDYGGIVPNIRFSESVFYVFYRSTFEKE